MGGLAFRLLGVPVRMHAAFLLAMGFLGWAMGREGVALLGWLVVAGSSVLIHELGHAVAFRRFGAEPEVVLHGFGGYTTGTAQPPGRSILVSLAGPGVGLVIGAGALLAARRFSLPPLFYDEFVFDLVFVNLGWGLFNLLPLLPLDGGNVMAAAFERRSGGRGRRTAQRVSVATAAALALVAVLFRQPFVAILAAYLALQNLRALGDVRDAPQIDQLNRARRLLFTGDWAGALAVVDEVASSKRSAAVDAAAVELRIWCLLAAGRGAEAETALTEARGGVGISSLSRSMVAVAAGRSVPLAPAFATGADAAAAKVASGMVVRAGLLDDLIRSLQALPPAQAQRGLEVLQMGLAAAGHPVEAERVTALRTQADPA